MNICLSLIFLSVLAQAGESKMNGLQLKDYPDFETKWHLVTVRYRKDTGEQRFTYANDIAWTAMNAGPDGEKIKNYPRQYQN